MLRGEGVPVEKIDEAEVYKHQGDYTKLLPSTKWLGSIYSGLSTRELLAVAGFIAEGELSYANAQMETREGYKGVGGCSLC